MRHIANEVATVSYNDKEMQMLLDRQRREYEEEKRRRLEEMTDHTAEEVKNEMSEEPKADSREKYISFAEREKSIESEFAYNGGIIRDALKKSRD